MAVGEGVEALRSYQAAEQNAAWALRQAATGLLYRTTAHRDIKPQEFVEDTGITPEKLGAYTRRFEEIVHRNGTTLGFFGHAPGPTVGMWDNQESVPVTGELATDVSSMVILPAPVRSASSAPIRAGIPSVTSLRAAPCLPSSTASIRRTN